MNNKSVLVKVMTWCWTGRHDDVIKWKHFPRYWPFVRGIHRPPVNSPHKGQWRGALMFTLICVWINGCVNNREAGDLRRYCAHYGVKVMPYCLNQWLIQFSVASVFVIGLRCLCENGPHKVDCMLELIAGWHKIAKFTGFYMVYDMEIFIILLVICERNPLVNGGFLAQM